MATDETAIARCFLGDGTTARAQWRASLPLANPPCCGKMVPLASQELLTHRRARLWLDTRKQGPHKGGSQCPCWRIAQSGSSLHNVWP